VAPQRITPRPKAPLNLAPGEADSLVSRARYVGSPEHKRGPSFAGVLRHPQSDNSICDPSLASQQQRLTQWLQEAIRHGLTGAPAENGWPRHLWHRDGEQWYEGRLTNQGLGEYKGWPVDEAEVPRWVRDLNG